MTGLRMALIQEQKSLVLQSSFESSSSKAEFHHVLADAISFARASNGQLTQIMVSMHDDDRNRTALVEMCDNICKVLERPGERLSKSAGRIDGVKDLFLVEIESVDTSDD